MLVGEGDQFRHFIETNSAIGRPEIDDSQATVPERDAFTVNGSQRQISHCERRGRLCAATEEYERCSEKDPHKLPPTNGDSTSAPRPQKLCRFMEKTLTHFADFLAFPGLPN